MRIVDAKIENLAMIAGNLPIKFNGHNHKATNIESE